MSSVYDLKDLNLVIRFIPSENKWIGYDTIFWDTLCAKKDTVDEVMDELKLKLRKIELKPALQIRRSLMGVVLQAEFFIQLDLIAILKNRGEGFYRIYYPKIVEQQAFKRKLQSSRLNEEDWLKVQVLLNQIETIGFPKQKMGLDGQVYTLRIGGHPNIIEYEWWNDSAGEQWKPLFQLRDLMNEFQQKYAEEKND